MSASKHGFFRRGFMLCDRCVLNGRCESFVPGGECDVEKKAYDWLVSEFMTRYELEDFVDELFVRRVVMYLVRIARAEVYEANVGVSDKSVVLGKYVAGLDKTLRGLLKDLALTRAERRKVEKDDMLVDVDRLLKGVEKRLKSEGKVMVRRLSPMRLLMKDWMTDMQDFKSIIKGDSSGEKDSEKCS